MIPRARFLPILLSVLSAPVLTAQLPVWVDGRIDPAPSGSCAQNATHKVRCSDLLLEPGPGVDLNALQGRVASLRGRLRLGLCPVLVVTEAEVAPASTGYLAIFGTRLGRPVVFTTFAPPGSLVFWLLAPDSGFLPVGPLGSLMLDLRSTLYWGSDLSIGLAVRTVTIPNAPALVGVTPHIQTVNVSLAPSLGVRLLNPVCFEIRQ